ncbi:tRNA (adenosine(37)-N6)-threonylcarbamoyltransferase complex transferase subunit TsaD [Hyphomonas sp.]|uniref:tRNA (adenosine(37)-N6)-threonylcarbamoyltransferase complex transferase subunit TsaD n=1 Tax=Hyphomonas sp. TaxID=87 RepID=UPI00341657DA|nr:tRNA (adenosine(37)-N6)-threonylcarbamoyltransferase complex transferase subunit TsaD [Hyphomonas sp.]
MPRMTQPLTILGIETSCDETAAAVLRLEDGRATLLSDVIRTQLEEHAPYRGVVPEIAARAHAELADAVVSKAMQDAGIGYDALDGVAATAGPGLIGGVLVGLMTGKAVAQAAGVPFIAVNHLEGHALSPRLSADCPFPYLLLLVSGGHCQFLEVRGLGEYVRLGSTIDDAVGEAFDKVAKLMGLGFPGGPAVERLAAAGNPDAHAFPRPLLNRPGLEMSFAGLKSAVARVAADAVTEAEKADICASFQAAICDVLAEKSRRALEGFDTGGAAKRFVVAGGVAANKAIRAALETAAADHGAHLVAPPLRHCTDNAAMIALAGAERMAAGLAGREDGLDAGSRPRWPLDEAAALATPVYGGGHKGAKA